MPVPVEMGRCICAMIHRYVTSRLVTYTQEITASITASILAFLGLQGGLYVFRPTVPALPDFTLAAGDFTTDFTWRTLDLSAILPRNGCCVRIYCRVEDNVASDLEFRRPGGPGVEGCVSSLTPGRPVALECSVNMAGAQAIEYRATNTVWTLIELTVTGWFTPISA